ncbi:MAG: 50S ribosomal protein L17 [Candidatus Levybacteria bacterium]|nr:50S ribosomal protein L17 [Candidatus Levybacteria bacterium]
MRKNVFGRHFKRDRNERKALFKSLISSLIMDEKIKTTEAKAKSIKSEVDKLVTKAKKEKPVRGLIDPYIRSDAVNKLIVEIAPRFKNRNGGYTRIVKLGKRFSDNASMVLMEWVEGEKVEVKSEKTKIKSNRAKGSRASLKPNSKTKPGLKLKKEIPSSRKAVRGKANK